MALPNYKTYKVDLDYESYLFDPLYKDNSPASLKINKEFEYVFFLINKDQCILKNVRNYEENYLEKLKKMGFVIPEFNPKVKNVEYWWGNRHDKDLERILNSKLTSAEMAKKRGWGFSKGIIVSSKNEVLEHIQNNVGNNLEAEWILKHPNSFSGIGHFKFKNNMDSFKGLDGNEKFLLEPFYERVFDIGTTFEIENGIIKNQFMVENFNSSNGRFRGGVGSSDLLKFKKYIFYKYKYNLDELEEVTKLIAGEYLKLGAKSNIEIDSFIYLEKGELKLYPLVEVNYRKTMGLVIQSLAHKYSDSDYIEWKILPSKDQLIPSLNHDWIKLSPDDTYFQSFLKPYSFTL